MVLFSWTLSLNMFSCCPISVFWSIFSHSDTRQLTRTRDRASASWGKNRTWRQLKQTWRTVNVTQNWLIPNKRMTLNSQGKTWSSYLKEGDIFTLPFVFYSLIFVTCLIEYLHKGSKQKVENDQICVLSMSIVYLSYSKSHEIGLPKTMYSLNVQKMHFVVICVVIWIYILY